MSDRYNELKKYNFEWIGGVFISIIISYYFAMQSFNVFSSWFTTILVLGVVLLFVGSYQMAKVYRINNKESVKVGGKK